MTQAERVVATARCSDYTGPEMSRALEAVLAPLGGMSSFVSPGQTVFVKVNLLMKAAPDRAVTTHPELARAVIRAAYAAGASAVALGDSPGGRSTAGSARALFVASGMSAVCEQEGARQVLLDDDVTRVPVEGRRLYAAFDLGREAVDADVLISLPKLKTHGFMAFTGAVKNLFGCIPGLQKAQFHLKVPDRDDFADMLLDLMAACRPALTVMDAVVGMEGEGPAGGTPRRIGALIASADPVALDVVASSIAGFDPMDVYTNRAAARRGTGPADADSVRVEGVAWRDLLVSDFAHPERDRSGGFPPVIRRWVRKRTVSRPVLAEPSGCTSCRTCADNCPVAAIRMAEGRPVFDLDRCIRCYCCQELCPAQVIGLRTPWLVRTAFGVRGGKA